MTWNTCELPRLARERGDKTKVHTVPFCALGHFVRWAIPDVLASAGGSLTPRRGDAERAWSSVLGRRRLLMLVGLPKICSSGPQRGPDAMPRDSVFMYTFWRCRCQWLFSAISQGVWVYGQAFGVRAGVAGRYDAAKALAHEAGGVGRGDSRNGLSGRRQSACHDGGRAATLAAVYQAVCAEVWMGGGTIDKPVRR
jgi:hypothetical protein